MIDHPLFKGQPQRAYAWLWLLSKAAWKRTPFDIKGVIVTLERGQVCTSRHQLAAEWGMSPSAVERFLTRLKTEQMIEQDTGQGRTIITICTYDKYQHEKKEAGQASGQVTGDRKSVGEGKSVSVRVDIGGRWILTKKKKNKKKIEQ